MIIVYQVFKGYLRQLREDGEDRVVHHEPIPEENLKKIRDELDLSNPTQLQQRVFVEVEMHFARRGREGLRALRKCSFACRHDENEKEFCHSGQQILINQSERLILYVLGVHLLPYPPRVLVSIHVRHPLDLGHTMKQARTPHIVQQPSNVLLKHRVRQRKPHDRMRHD